MDPALAGLNDLEKSVVEKEFDGVPLQIRVMLWNEMKKQWVLDRSRYQKRAALALQQSLRGCWRAPLLESCACVSPPFLH